ncbi:non-hydrolyzing UDP-N-acetylglucosamine 2-epimerase [Variovorax boronicumulans]|uniref:non-hydrolyzing UDP-N-acetylglucosamine 2-epimerase n=1 Tax=Variovorax boronicumulans TaxID=436515 RepID=UPI0012E6DBD4|nr:UDP-N-acetylglucosamine 2-epimerase (non-hydrolyzing) [Variovorax boronicumulans]GER12851.1 UDP-N-acetylglucosamine 2-epimerase (non-hydrolyzing) [Variovorax boronicumulans]
MKILTVIGARPQFIKASVISRALSSMHSNVQEVLVHTGQHYDANMSDVFFTELGIPCPTHNLGIGGGTHGENTGRMLEKLEALMLLERPDRVLVYGDTDSTLAGSLAASKLHIPVAHVEAGLRSFNRKMPEEINRVLTDHLSSLLFAPTDRACSNLIKEGVAKEAIHRTGDVMYDVALLFKEHAKKPDWFDQAELRKDAFALCTIHRAENTDSPQNLKEILKGLDSENVKFVLPLHPRTRLKLQKIGAPLPSNVHVTEPVGYLEMMWLEANSKFIVTDSGGVQKEAYFHRKFCITLREETEWMELVEHQVNTLVGADSKRISDAIDGDTSFQSDAELYGDGLSAVRISKILTGDFL